MPDINEPLYPELEKVVNSHKEKMLDICHKDDSLEIKDMDLFHIVYGNIVYIICNASMYDPEVNMNRKNLCVSYQPRVKTKDEYLQGFFTPLTKPNPNPYSLMPTLRHDLIVIVRFSDTRTIYENPSLNLDNIVQYEQKIMDTKVKNSLITNILESVTSKLTDN